MFLYVSHPCVIEDECYVLIMAEEEKTEES
jgi:hypothetical protein